MRALNHIVATLVGAVGLAVSVPAQASVTPYGVSCGPVLAGDIHENPNHSTLTLQVTHGEPHALAAMVIGVRPLVTPLPFSSCLLLTEAYYLEAFQLNGAGMAFWHLTLPTGFHGEARMQVLEVLLGGVAGLELMSSNGVYVLVPPV